MKYEKVIFTFGSNEKGNHGAGAAKEARLHHGAIMDKGVGIQGNSFAIPTKDKYLHTLPLNEVKDYVDMFIRFAKSHPTYKFNVTRIGCGLAGLKEKDIAPMFKEAPENVYLPESFINITKTNHQISFDKHDMLVGNIMSFSRKNK